MVEDIFCERLAKAREVSGLSVAELAERCGTIPAAISHFTTGRRTPNIVHLRLLAEALWVSVDYLVGISDVMRPTHDVSFENIDGLSLEQREVVQELINVLSKKKGKEYVK